MKNFFFKFIKLRLTSFSLKNEKIVFLKMNFCIEVFNECFKKNCLKYIIGDLRTKDWFDFVKIFIDSFFRRSFLIFKDFLFEIQFVRVEFWVRLLVFNCFIIKRSLRHFLRRLYFIFLILLLIFFMLKVIVSLRLTRWVNNLIFFAPLGSFFNNLFVKGNLERGVFAFKTLVRTEGLRNFQFILKVFCIFWVLIFIFFINNLFRCKSLGFLDFEEK